MANFSQKPVALVLLDGWGYSSKSAGNAIEAAHTPNYDELCLNFPSTHLSATPESNGDIGGMSGDAELGHLAIGTGRTAYSEATRIASSIRDGSFFNNDVLLHTFAQAFANQRPVHLIGLLSDGGKHSSTETLYALLRMAKRAGVDEVFIHGILDGVDVSVRTADIYVEALEIKLADIGIGRIATLCGRHFAMDSADNWDRTARVFTMLVHAEGERTGDTVQSIRNSFLRGITDEFIAPIVFESAPDVPVAQISDGDTVIFFNHRPEAMRQLVRSLIVPDSTGSAKPGIDAVCMVDYDHEIELPTAFPSERMSNSLADVLSAAGVPNYKITQSERFRHLTYFFNGGVESEPEGETQILLSTPKDEVPALRPESQSFKITDQFLSSLEPEPRSLYTVNFPAAAIAAATGSMEKTIEAIQFLDTCLGGIVRHMREVGGTVLVTSSHGYCEAMPEHEARNVRPSADLVPFHLIADGLNGTRLRDGGSLSDIAPTILGLLGLDVPAEMTGRDLRVD